MKRILIVLLLFFIGMSLRIYRWENYSFGYDQVQILENAQEILTGKFTLIGPKTGPAAMFTGPLIYYATAWVLIFVKNFYAIFITTWLIELITALAIFFLGEWIEKDGRTSLILLGLWALSAYLIGLDRISWNPNLSLLSACLVFFPLFKMVRIKNNQSKLAIALISLGIFLGYQAHFSGLLLPIIVLGYWFFGMRMKPKMLGASVLLALFASLLPTILFDFRHDWLNLKGFLALMGEKAVSESPILVRLFNNLVITMENTGKLILYGKPLLVTLGIGGLLLLTYWLMVRNKREKSLVTYWVLMIVFLMTVYRQKSPEYYYLVQFPALLWMIKTILLKINKPVLLVGLAVGLMFININSFNTFYSESGGITIGRQLSALKIIKNWSDETGIKEIKLTMAPVDAVGLVYLKNRMEFNSGDRTAEIVYPIQSEAPARERLGGLGLRLSD